MALSDRFKNVSERAEQLAEQAAGELQEAAETAKNKTAELANENRDRIGSAIDKTAATVAEHTSDRYRDRIDGVRAKAHDGLEKVADSAEPGPEAGPEAGPDVDPDPDPRPDPTAGPDA